MSPYGRSLTSHAQLQQLQRATKCLPGLIGPIKKKKQLSVHWAMLYLLTMGTIWNQSSLAHFRFSFFLLQIKYEASITVCHSPVHICWRKTPWARNGKRWSFHPGPRWTLAGEQECMRRKKPKERQREEAKSMAFSVGLQSDPPAQ